MTGPWRVEPLEVAEPAALLDRSDALLARLAEDPRPTLRWYQATRTAVVRGRGQRRLRLHHQDGVADVTRGSGGGAVLLDPAMLSLDIALPAGHPWLTRGGASGRAALAAPASPDPTGVFLVVGTVWRDALERLGVPGLRVHREPTLRPADPARAALLTAVCFALPSRGEVLAGERKLVGLSQRRRRHGALVQCGLLRRWDPTLLLTALGADPDDAEVHRAAVGLDELCDDAPSDAEVIAAVEAAMRAADTVDTEPQPHAPDTAT